MDSHTLKAPSTGKHSTGNIAELVSILFSAELFLDHLLRQEYGPTKESSSA
jgi:hypothetical protein